MKRASSSAASGVVLVGWIGCASCVSATRLPPASDGASQTETRSAEYRREAEVRVPDTEAPPPSPDELRARGAFERLAPFAAVHEQPRGIVVVLPASVLFERTGSALMETARAHLDRVVDAVGTVPSRPIVVRSHVARSEDATRDLALSQQRGEAVCAYLLARGVAAGRLRVESLGRGEPVASNATAAGRAENPRIEIVIEGAGAAAAAP